MKKKIITFIVKQKFRFDLAMTLMTFINFALLAVTASSSIQAFLTKIGINFNLYSVVGYIILISFGLVWLCGYILDKVVNYQEEMATQLNIRNKEFMELLEQLKKMDKIICKK